MTRNAHDYTQNISDKHNLFASQSYKDSIYRYGFVHGMRNTDGWPITRKKFNYLYAGGYVIGHFYHNKWMMKRVLRGQRIEEVEPWT